MGKRRILCFLLALVLTIGLLPMSVEAADSHPNTHVSTGNNRYDIIGVARSQVGYMETGNNNTKYGSWYGLNYNPWCAMFVSWCARSAGVSTYILKNSALATPAYSGFNLSYYSGRDYTPQPGDIFYKYTTEFSHTGLVYYVDGEYFYTIEGNATNDGTDNGNRVLCLKRKISDFYFSSPNYVLGDTPAAPVVTTAAKEYEQGTTKHVEITWQPVEDAVSYQVTVYYNGDIVRNNNVGLNTAYILDHVEVGNYLISVSAKYSGGKEGFGQWAFDVVPPPKLTVNYHANGGVITPVYKYMVNNGDGINFRASYSTSSARIGWLPLGTQLDIYQIVYYGGNNWGQTYYNGSYGWCCLDLCQRIGYGQNADGIIIQYPYSTQPTTTWAAGVDGAKALWDPQSLGLSKEYHRFVGWSTTPDGTTPALGRDGANVTATEIAPGFGREDMSLTLYAVWEKIVDSIAIESMPAKTEYYAEETLDTTGLSLRVKYADGTEAVLVDGFTVTGFDPSTTGEQILKVSLGDKETTIRVKVDARFKYDVVDESVVITQYIQGEGGMVIVPATIAGLPVKAIAENAFADCDKITAISFMEGLETIGENAFAGCSALTVVNYTGSCEQWNAIVIGSGNEVLAAAELTCDYMVLGDYTGDLKVDSNDVLYLLKHTLFADMFPVTMSADLNRDSAVNSQDVLLLLKHCLFPDMFPLQADDSAEEPAEEPVEEPTDAPSEESAEETTEEPVEEPTEETTEQPIDEPVDAVME